MPIVPPEPATVSSTGFYQQPTTTAVSPQPASQPASPNAGNAFLIAIEVIFSCLVIVVLLFCFFTGVRKKKRARVNQQQMIENAITQQERRIQLHMQGQCHSSSTVTTLVQCPLPAPPPPTSKTLFAKRRGSTTGLPIRTKSNMHNDNDNNNNKTQ
ncbi:hypothetical protein MBANPS3_008082 [Mucor bainieri]